METFRIDNKDPLYKKLIKLPTTYYGLESDGNRYTIHSHNDDTVETKGISNVKLKWENGQIVLYEGDSALKLKDKDFVIEQEDIIGENKNDIIKKLRSEEEVLISHKYIKSSPNSAVGLSYLNDDGSKLTGVLNFINFNDKNDPVLKKIIEEKGGLYFTIEGGNIYISDKDGKCLPVCPDDKCYQYQYMKNECDTLEISEISKVIKSLTKANDVQQDFTLQKGEKLSDGIYEANVVLSGKTIVATLPKIGYYMLNDQLVMRNHVTKEEVVIPRDFHYLKVVKFGDNDYKLTFCNVLGNEFFEYKRYDPQYSNVSDEYKFISLSCARKNYNPSFGELLNHRPSFFIKEGPAEPGSDKYAAAVFELTPNGKGRKMATLIDEFGYFDQNSMFKHCDYHKGIGYHSDNPAEIEKKYKITDADNEFYLMEHDDITLHAIPEL